MTSTLARLYRAYEEGGEPAARVYAQAHRLDLGEEQRVRVVVELLEKPLLKGRPLFESLGFVVECSHDQSVQGLVPVAQLKHLALSPGVEWVRPPMEPLSMVTSEGVAIIGADDWHSAGVDGTGKSVAVLDLGFQGYTSLLGSELPSSVIVHSARSDGNILAGGEHGTGCAEIVYDVAPGAQMYLVNFSTDVEFSNAIDYILAQHVDVVSCSIGWPISGPGDGTGPIASLVTDAYDAGLLWANAAGNQAEYHWMGTWADADANDLLEYIPGDETNTISVSYGQYVRIGLRWDDDWTAALDSFSLELYDSGLNLVDSDTTPIYSGSPTRFLSLGPGLAGIHHIVIRRLDSNATSPVLELFTYDQKLTEHSTAESSIVVPADAAEVVAVGAVPYFAPTALEDFSSRGPSRDGRIKPDLVAPDGVSNVTYNPYGGFYGTSASCPHVAGAAALVWAYYDSLSHIEVAAFLRGSTIDLGAVGPDNDFGNGRLSLPLPSAETPTPTPSPSPTATGTATCTNTPTVTATPTGTSIPTSTATATSSPTPTGTSMPTATATATPVSGTFVDSEQSLGSAYDRGVALGDVDGDGDLDAFVANSGANKVWCNDGGVQGGTQGTFSDSGQSLGSANSHGLALGDVDGDGDLDAIVANYGQANRVWLNNGGAQGGTPGSFSDSGQSLGGANSYSVALGDVDGDGDLDVFVANNGANKVWLNDGGAQGGTPGAFTDSGQGLGSTRSMGVVLGDVNGDGNLDAFVANLGHPNKVWLSNGMGTFNDSGQSLGNSLSYGLALGDVDGDGHLDAFVTNSGINKVWVNGGAGIFGDSGQSLGSSSSYAVALKDVDGDGHLDAFVANYNQANKVWLNNGTGSFSDSGQTLGSSLSRDVALGDMDGDGDLDAFVVNYGQANTVWWNLTSASGPTETPTATRTPTTVPTVPTVSLTPTTTGTPTQTSTPTLTITETTTVTPTATPTGTLSPTVTGVPTHTSTPTGTLIESLTPTPSATPTGTLSPTVTGVPTHTSTPTATVIESLTPTPSATPTSIPTGWHRVALPGRTVRDLIIHPQDPRRVMACVAGEAWGIYVTDDGGETWNTAYSGLLDSNVYRLAQEPGTPWTIYAASDSRLWKTTNGGQDWSHLPVLGASFSWLSGLAAAPSHAGRLYLTAWDPCDAAFVSPDGGSSWTQNAAPDLCSLSPLDSSIKVSRLDPDLLYLARGHDLPELYRSEDGGAQWTRLADVGGGQGVSDLALDSKDDQHLYAATYGSGVYITRDKGATWSPASYGLPGTGAGDRVTALCLQPGDASTVYGGVEGAGVYRSEIGGLWWERYGEGLPTSAMVYALRISSRWPGRLWAATSDGIWVIDRYGSWLPLVFKSPGAAPPPTDTPTPTLEPYPPPATAVPTSTASPTSIATPTPTPTGGNCYEEIENGGFEWVGIWKRGVTPHGAEYTSAVYHSGFWSMRHGIEPGVAMEESHSSIYQLFTIPASATSATLRLWWRRHTEETVAGALRLHVASEEGTSLTMLPYEDDLQEVLLLNSADFMVVDMLERWRANDGDWVQVAHDLTPYRGRTLVLYINAYNDGLGGRTWMYVDDVSIKVCLPGG